MPRGFRWSTLEKQKGSLLVIVTIVYIYKIKSCGHTKNVTVWLTAYLQVGSNVRATQLGVVARGSECAGFNQPGIYTRKHSFYN